MNTTTALILIGFAIYGVLVGIILTTLEWLRGRQWR